MTINTSSWAIRNPIPVALLFVLLTSLGLMSFRGMVIQDLPDVDIPRVVVSASLPGAAPALMETEVARKIENAIATVDGVNHITTTLTDGHAEIGIEFLLEKSIQEAVDDVRDAVSRIRSDLPAEMRDPVIRNRGFSEDPLLLYAVTSSRLDEEALSWFVEDRVTRAVLTVPGARGMVPLENVASLEWSSGPAEITRYDRLRNVNFEVVLQGRPLGEIEQIVQALPSVRQLPPGIYQAAAGDAEEMAEVAAGFGVAMLTGVLCIYMVLVLLFGSFMQPVTILVALVLSVPGAFLALFLTQSALSLPAMIGMIMLMGIATKNSILLIDYIIIARRDHGLNRLDAIIDACRKRVRPIVMTTLAMGAGMLPVAMGWAGAPSFRAPMAFVVIGGLITSTLLSLLVIPVVYSCVDDAVGWTARRFRGERSAASPDAP